MELTEQLRDEVTLEAIAYLRGRGYVLGVDFVEGNAVELAAEIVYARGFGPVVH